MGLLSQKIHRSELMPGDHIYTWRKLQTYSHHGIFIGDRDMIIHFVNAIKDDVKSRKDETPHFSFASAASSVSSVKCRRSRCGYENKEGSGVRMTCVDCFIENGSIYRFNYQVSSFFLVAKLRGGTCTTAASDPPQEVIHRAMYLYYNGYEEYDWMNNNCEDFALYCKTGLWSCNKNYPGRSSQANMIHPTAEEDRIRIGLLRVITAIPRSIFKREENDLGVRKDVVKVPVETLSSFLHSLREYHNETI